MEFTAALDRRSLLSLGLLAAGAVIADSVGLPLSEAQAAGLPRWSDPSTWGGAVPTSDSKVTLDKTVLLDVDVTVASLTIAATGVLVFDPDSSRSLSSSGNVVVLGVLQMRPRTGDQRHVLRFPSVNEAAFQGGGMSVLDSDVGLWCMEHGLLDIAGTPKLAWGRTAGSVPAGTRTITLQSDPAGWRVGDELAIAPTGAPKRRHDDSYDYSVVRAISGRTITLSTPTVFDHPAVDVGKGLVVSPEVLNLTRNVTLEGSPNGRAHVFLMPSRVQNLSYFSCRWMGPRQADGTHTKGVLGRYGLHFHMGGDATRGSQIIGGVVRDTGAQAFVPHASHGITFTSCVSHDTIGPAYWWDDMVDTRTAGPVTNDVSYVSCVASRVRVDPPFRGYRLTAFALGAGKGNRALDCVAVGVQGNRDASGFLWSESANGTGVWDFRRCVSHNNARHGIFTWQNTPNPHVVEDFVCYHNGGAGISHGAYMNRYHYTNGFLYGNAGSAVLLHATSRTSDGQLRFSNLHCDGAGISAYGVDVTKHTLESHTPTLFLGCTFRGHTRQALATTHGRTAGGTVPSRIDLVSCTSTTPMLWLRDDTVPASTIRVQDGAGAVVARAKGQPGKLRPEWNAMTTAIAPFHAEAVPASKAFAVAGGAVVLEAPAPQRPGAPTGPQRPHAGHEAPGDSATSQRQPPAPSPDHDAIAMSLRSSSTKQRLVVSNRGDHPCDVTIRIDGASTFTRAVPPGSTVIRFNTVRSSEWVKASCHSRTWTWKVPATR